MKDRSRQLTFGLLALVAVASLTTTAYLYGKSRAQGSDAIRPDAQARARILLGRVVRIEPLHVYVESDSLGQERTYDVLISPLTDIFHLTQWEPGEREMAVNDRLAYLERMKPKSGDRVPAPVPELKPEPFDLSTLAAGSMVGVLSIAPIEPGKPIVAGAIRPLTDEEARSGQVANTFPL